jgi:L-2,4-diaminobutyrate decarboxylase
VEPESNIVCFRYLKRGEGDLDGLQRRVRRALLERGRFYIVQTNLRGHVWLRSTLINSRTTLADLEALLIGPKGRVPRACPWVNEAAAIRYNV